MFAINNILIEPNDVLLAFEECALFAKLNKDYFIEIYDYFFKIYFHKH